jgi:hypothetical protein
MSSPRSTRSRPGQACGATPRRLRPPPPDLRWTLCVAAGPTFVGRSAGRGGRPRQRSRKKETECLFFFIFCFFIFSIFSIFNLPDKWALYPHQQAYFFFAM